MKMTKRSFEITLRFKEGMFLHTEGGTLSDSNGEAVTFGSVVPSQMPYFAFHRGPNKGYYGCDLTHLQKQLTKIVVGEIIAEEE